MGKRHDRDVLIEVANANRIDGGVDIRTTSDESDQFRRTQDDDLVCALLAQLGVAHELDRVTETLLVPDQQASAWRPIPRRCAEAGSFATDTLMTQAGFVVSPPVDVVTHRKL